MFIYVSIHLNVYFIIIPKTDKINLAYWFNYIHQNNVTPCSVFWKMVGSDDIFGIKINTVWFMWQYSLFLLQVNMAFNDKKWKINFLWTLQINSTDLANTCQRIYILLTVILRFTAALNQMKDSTERKNSGE